jgi:hypothetical protein
MILYLTAHGVRQGHRKPTKMDRCTTTAQQLKATVIKPWLSARESWLQELGKISNQAHEILVITPAS